MTTVYLVSTGDSYKFYEDQDKAQTHYNLLKRAQVACWLLRMENPLILDAYTPQ